MAASQLLIFGKDVQTGAPWSCKLYLASSGAVGTYCPVRLKGDAAATDSVDLHVPFNVVVYDVISPVATSGEIRLESDGEDTYFLINIASRAPTNAGRNQNLGIPLGVGKVYRFKVETALPA